jgi:hypothetical protein
VYSLYVSEPLPTTSPAASADDRAADGIDVQAVRAWARSRGYPIDESGAIPLTVLHTYRRLHPC